MFNLVLGEVNAAP